MQFRVTVNEAGWSGERLIDLSVNSPPANRANELTKLCCRRRNARDDDDLITGKGESVRDDVKLCRLVSFFPFHRTSLPSLLSSPLVLNVTTTCFVPARVFCFLEFRCLRLGPWPRDIPSTVTKGVDRESTINECDGSIKVTGGWFESCLVRNFGFLGVWKNFLSSLSFCSFSLFFLFVIKISNLNQWFKISRCYLLFNSVDIIIVK